MSLFGLFQMLKGGPTSGNFGHQGVPGHLGGSAPKGESGIINIDSSNAGLVKEWEKALGVKLPEDDGKHYYHSTTIDNLDSIKEKGLEPTKGNTFEGFSTGEKVSLAPTLEDAAYWSSMSMWADYDKRKDGTVRKPIILRVPNDIKVESYRGDEVRTDRVSKDKLEILTNNGWKKL